MKTLSKAAAAPAEEGTVAPEHVEFQKQLEDLCADARVAFVILRATREQLLDVDAAIGDTYQKLVAGTRKAKVLAGFMETAELRFAELVLKQRP